MIGYLNKSISTWEGGLLYLNSFRERHILFLAECLSCSGEMRAQPAEYPHALCVITRTLATRVFLAPFIGPTQNLVDKWRIVDLAFVLDIASRGVDETRREYSFYC